MDDTTIRMLVLFSPFMLLGTGVVIGAWRLKAKEDLRRTQQALTRQYEEMV